MPTVEKRGRYGRAFAPFTALDKLLGFSSAERECKSLHA